MDREEEGENINSTQGEEDDEFADDDQFIEQGEMVEIDVGDEPPEDSDDDEDVVNDENNGETGAEPDLNIEDLSLASFNFHGDSVYCAAIHPTRPGIILSGGGDDRAFLWKYIIPSDISVLGDTFHPSEQYGKGIEFCIELPGHSDTVTSVGFNFDGTLALTGGYDGVVNIWSLSPSSTEPGSTLQPTLLHRLEGPEDVEWATWHSKGNAVLAGSKDGTIWMWLANTGQCVQVFAGHDGGVSCGLFTLDGKSVCSGGEDGTVRIWAPKTGVCKHNFNGEMGGGHASSVTCISGSEDGELLVTGGFDGEVHLFHVSGKRLVKKFIHSQPVKLDTPLGTDGAALPSPPPPAHHEGDEGDDNDWVDDDEDEGGDEEKEMVQSVECVGISKTEHKWLASGGSDKTLKIWDISSGICRCVCRHDGSVVALKWHHTLPLIATASLDYKIRLWDARSGTCLQTLTGHRDLVTNLDFQKVPSSSPSSSPQMDAIASVSDDGTVKIFLVDIASLIN